MFFLNMRALFFFNYFSGSYVTILDRVSDKKVQINGSYPDDYEVRNNTFFPETIVQMDLGMLYKERNI
jgi:hypothetical protein